MTLQDLALFVAQISGLLFIVASMLAMGLGLTIGQIAQPLKNMRLVGVALLANFVLAPALAWAITLILPLEQDLRIGLIVLGTVAGAPFLPKLVQGAKGNLAHGVAVMFLLMVVTIFYAPLVLPLLLAGVEVNPWDIAQSLIFLMLIPLALGLLYAAHSPESAARWQPVMNKISSLAILLLLVTGVGLSLPTIVGLIGGYGILALILFIAGSFGIGFLLGGRDASERSVMALGTAQRNVSAAILIAAQNFPGTTTLPYILTAAIVLLLILLPTARWLGARSGTGAPKTAKAVAKR